ncbi:hypothetical protein ACFYXM_23280 [Streptomyces sp. NPDC002476]|uniref:hypothetical protein n=1 Tax=Streptomyces sp. NPDC002476 TaxID=3364648 RepID=UPI00368BCC4E
MSDSSPASAPPALPGNGPGRPAPRGPSPVARPLPVAHTSRGARRPPVVAVTVAVTVSLFPPGTEPPRPRGRHTAEGDTR